MKIASMPFFDNHTHPLDADKVDLTPDALALIWLHGFRDLPGGKVSEKFNHHVHNQGCVYTMVYQLSKLFGCENTLEAVTAERNRRTAQGAAPYAQLLYKDGGIACSLLDSDYPYGDERLSLFPGILLRHIQMDPLFFDLLKDAADYASMLEQYKLRIRMMVADQGYVSIKSHIGELFTTCVRYVPEEEATAAFVSARQGNKQAQRTLYYAVFHQTMLLAQDLNIPIHIHTGMTGGFWDGEMDDADPYRMAPFLRNTPHMQQTTLVLLHSNYPFMSSAALVAHTFPHVWVDLAWVLPWVSLSFTQCIEDLIGIAPVSKILLGSGQHNIPEIAWLSSKVAKSALQYVTDKLVAQEMLSQEQGNELAAMLLYKNALRLYGVAEDRFVNALG